MGFEDVECATLDKSSITGTFSREPGNNYTVTY